MSEQPIRPGRSLEHPPFSYSDYRSSVLRSPTHDAVVLVASLTERTGPGPVWLEDHPVQPGDDDLTTNARTGAEALGPRTIVTGTVRDAAGVAQPRTLIEIWQANAAGRYVHWREVDFPAPHDPNFVGVGRCVTDASGVYRFTTVRPGAYPWGNHPNAWRPAHVHLSLWGGSLMSRLVTQFYFEGDPLLALDPIFHSVPEHARERLVARYDHDVTVTNWALGYRFDIVLNGPFGTSELHGEGNS